MLEVETRLGPAFALLVIDYGPTLNSCWVVALKKDGQVKHLDSNDVRLQPNFTYGIAG